MIADTSVSASGQGISDKQQACRPIGLFHMEPEYLQRLRRGMKPHVRELLILLQPYQCYAVQTVSRAAESQMEPHQLLWLCTGMQLAHMGYAPHTVVCPRCTAQNSTSTCIHWVWHSTHHSSKKWKLPHALLSCRFRKVPRLNGPCLAYI